jgi:hypothetical protein
MTGPRLRSADARLVRRLLAGVAGFATAFAIVVADWWWIPVALVAVLGWFLERRTSVQSVGDDVVVRNRLSGHVVSRHDVVGIDAAPCIAGLRARLLLHDGRRVPLVAFTLVEPDDRAIDATVRELARALGVAARRSVV